MMDFQKLGLKLQCSLLASIVHDYLLPFEPLMRLGTTSPFHVGRKKLVVNITMHTRGGGGAKKLVVNITMHTRGGFMLGEKTSSEYYHAHKEGGGGGGVHVGRKKLVVNITMHTRGGGGGGVHVGRKKLVVNITMHTTLVAQYRGRE